MSHPAVEMAKGIEDRFMTNALNTLWVALYVTINGWCRIRLLPFSDALLLLTHCGR